MFGAHGGVVSVTIVKDQLNRSKGFGFVEVCSSTLFPPSRSTPPPPPAFPSKGHGFTVDRPTLTSPFFFPPPSLFSPLFLSHAPRWRSRRKERRPLLRWTEERLTDVRLTYDWAQARLSRVCARIVRWPRRREGSCRLRWMTTSYEGVVNKCESVLYVYVCVRSWEGGRIEQAPGSDGK